MFYYQLWITTISFNLVHVYIRHDLPESNLWTATLKNVVIVKINDSDVCRNTPAEGFYQKFITEHIKTTNYSLPELSDILRLCLVYKQGGTYIDTDTIMVKSFPDEYRNFLTDESGLIVNGLFDFDAGNDHLKEVLAILESNYNVSTWGSIGPAAFRKVFHRNMTSVEILPEYIFYPIRYNQVMSILVKEDKSKIAFDMINNHNETIGVHVYRSIFSFNGLSQYSSRSALGLLMKEHCPPVYHAKNIKGNFTFHNRISKYD